MERKHLNPMAVWRHTQEKRHEAAEQLADIAEEFPDLIADLMKAMNGSPKTPTPATTSTANQNRDDQPARTQFQRIGDHYVETDNAWALIPSVAEATEVSRASIAQIMSGRHKADFESMPHEQFARMKYWRMKPEAFEAFRAAH